MTVRESVLTKAALKALNALDDVHAWKQHIDPFATAGMPDIAIVKRVQPTMTMSADPIGLSLYIEMKKPGEKMTALQKARAEKLSAFGARVAVCFSADEAVAFVQGCHLGFVDSEARTLLAPREKP